MAWRVNLQNEAKWHIRQFIETSPNHSFLFSNESVVPKDQEQKHLGLTLDSKLSFERIKKVLESLNIFQNSYPLKVAPHRRPLYRLNNTNTFQEIRCKTARYKNSFFPDANSSWNNMISNFQDIPTFTVLKSHLLSLIRPKVKSTFGIHDALGLRYLFQLRVNLSPLRSHKRRPVHLLRLASVILVLQIFAIFYLNAPFTQFEEWP